ncbi:MAG: PaaI family thioesterase [Alphaproteobacteria bacterium]|nr:PaaI family thioesterase [Alphaproteobacteria bacterium]
MPPVDISRLPRIKARELLGGDLLAVDDTSGEARLRYVPGEHLNNPVGTVLGGYTAAMIDDAAGVAAWFGGGKRPFATAQMSVNFLRPARAGEALIANARVAGVGQQQAFVEVRIVREADDKLVAAGSIVQIFVDSLRRGA